MLAAQFMPVLLGGPFGGLVADRYRKRNVLLVTQSLFTIPSLRAVRRQRDRPRAVLDGRSSRRSPPAPSTLFDVPARQSFVIEMVGRQDLMNAIALNSSVFNASAVIGPAIAGLVIAAVGVPICFLANSVSYLAAIVALLAHARPARVVARTS